MKKSFFIFVLITLLLATRAFASVRINEIMYDVEGSDGGREWIEVYNDGSAAVDLSKWKLFETDTNHGLASYQGNISLSSGNFALIADNPAKFLIDWPNFNGTIFKSSFSLSNTGESLALKDENSNIVDQINYSSSLGAAGDGKSLQLIDSKFIPADPTPGGPNNLESSPESSPVTANLISSINSNQVPNTQTVSDSNTYKLGIVVPEKILAGVPFIVTLKAEYGNQPVTSGKFYWNFGNGETKESDKNEPFNYIYSIPGNYMIVLDYSKNASDQNPVSTARFKITVLPNAVVAPILETSKENTPLVVEQKPISPIKLIVVKKAEVASVAKVKASDLKANVLDGAKKVNSSNNKSSLIPWFLALVGFILISLFSIFLFKKSPKPQTQNISKESDDFEIN